MLRALLALAVVAALPASAEAQSRTRPQEQPRLPAHLMPPVGKCRIWVDGVPAAQQPAPTDCQTALRQKPANGTVVFGPSSRDEAGNGFRQATPAARDTSRGTARPTRGRPDSSPPRPPARSPNETPRETPRGTPAGTKSEPRPRPDSGRRPDPTPPQQMERTS